MPRLLAACGVESVGGMREGAGRVSCCCWVEEAETRPWPMVGATLERAADAPPPMKFNPDPKTHAPTPIPPHAHL